jgi:hypothetical protein
MSALETAVGEEVIAKIAAIARSYPEGVTPESIKRSFGYENTNVVRAALEILQQRSEVVKDGDVYRSSIYSK